MTFKNTEDKLRELAYYIAEPIPPRLGEKIKSTIPTRLQHRWSKDAVNIIIHLRISRVTAIVTILMTLVLCWFLFGSHTGGNSNLATNFILELLPKTSENLVAFEGYYQKLLKDGYEAVFFGDIANADNPNDILLYYRLDDEHYRVIFASNRSPEVVSTAELIHLQERMIRNQSSR